jgi:hypothetical protein
MKRVLVKALHGRNKPLNHEFHEEQAMFRFSFQGSEIDFMFFMVKSC